MVGTVKSGLATRTPTITMNTCEMPSAMPMVPRVRKGVRTDLKKRPVAMMSSPMVTGKMIVRSAWVEVLKS
jgi:hypothetical protein